MAARRDRYRQSVFINCPFDNQYWPLFEALVFSVIACKFDPRCALEELDSGTVRLEKVVRIIRSCRLAVHDLSRVELSGRRSRPRFNMPFELGLDIGCRRFGRREFGKKRILILDSKRHRYQAFISDISGQDIPTHNNVPDNLIRRVRDWLRVNSGRSALPGQRHITRSFRAFTRSLPENCRQNGLDRKNLLFVDYVWLARIWIEAEREPVV
jgi:hypothetical protein